MNNLLYIHKMLLQLYLYTGASSNMGEEEMTFKVIE